MVQQRCELSHRSLVESFCQKLPGLQHQRVCVERGVVHAINPAFTRNGPAIDPIRNIQTAIDAKFDICGEHVPNEVMSISHLKPSALGPDGEGMDAASLSRSAKISQKEMP